MGFTNLQQFNLKLDEFADKIPERGLLFQKKVAFMVLGGYVEINGQLRAVVGVLQLTPVDTGRAVGNWQVSIGSPAQGTVERFRDNRFGGTKNRAAAERVAIRAATSALGGLQFAQTIWIVDNVAYIRVLNDGGLNRTAHHMAERALANTRRALRSGIN